MSSTVNSELVYIVSHYSQEIKLAETIIFPEEFNGIEISNVPEGVKHIEIKVHNQDLTIHLPESLKTLHLDCSFKEINLPDALEYIELGPNSRGEIRKWPKSLKKLSICKSDVVSLTSLPDSLEYLNLDITFEHKFNKYQLTGLPKSLKTLIIRPWLGNNTERSLWLKDLTNLKHLEFKGIFYSLSSANNIIKNLPSELKILKGLDIQGTERNIRGQFPDTLEYLSGNFNYKGELPKNLKVLVCPLCEISSALPESLLYLCASSIKGEAIKSIARLQKLRILICNEYNPDCETDVKFTYALECIEIKSSARNITIFPDNLKTLIMPISVLFNNNIRLPENLETLKLTKCGFSSELITSFGFKIIFQHN
jgi:hypothetical protein